MTGVMPALVDQPPSEVDEIRAKIIHVLRIYHVLNPTMVQAGLGHPLPPSKWRPVLESLIADGTVKRVEQTIKSHKDQMRTYTRIFLANQGEIYPVEARTQSLEDVDA